MYIRLRNLNDEGSSTFLNTENLTDQSMEELLLDDQVDIVNSTFPDAEPEVFHNND
jgi:hypothetical protein